MAVTRGHCQHLSSHVFGQAIGQGGTIGQKHFAHTGNLGSSSSSSRCVVAGHQHMHLAAQSGSRGHGVEGGRFDGNVVVFSNHERCHGVSPA